MSNMNDRHKVRKKIMEFRNGIANGQLRCNISIAIMQNEILEEYLWEKTRSDKVIEGLLKDIRAEIEQSTETKTKEFNSLTNILLGLSDAIHRV